MFKKDELEILNLCLLVQIMELKEKLKYNKVCRMLDRFKACKRQIENLEELRRKVIFLQNADGQLSYIDG